MAYNNADIMGDLDKLMYAAPFDQFRDGLANIKTQIDFVTESINDLEGLEYANALATIADLERQDYETRLQYLYQLKTMQDGLLDSLSAQTESFRWDVMSPEERFNAKSQELSDDWSAIYSAASPEAVASAVTEWLSDQQTLWGLGDDDWKKANFAGFEENNAAIATYIQDTFGLTMDDIKNGMDPIKDSVNGAVDGLDAFSSRMTDINDELITAKDLYADANLELASLTTALQDAVTRIQNINSQLAWEDPEVNA